MNNNKTLKITMLIGTILLAIGVTLFFIYIKKDTGTVTTDTDNGSFVPFIPIWAAIFPTLIASRKNKEELNPKQRTWVIIFVGITVLAVVGTFIYLMLR